MEINFFGYHIGGGSSKTSAVAEPPAPARQAEDRPRPTEEDPIMMGTFSATGDGTKLPETPRMASLSAAAAMATPRKEPDDDTGWRKISAGAGGNMVGTTVDIQNRWSILNVTRRILRKNPFLLRNYLLPVTACVVGSGIKLRAADTKVQTILDDFVKLNAFHAKFQSFLHNLYQVEGELVLPIKADPSGNVRVTFVYTDTVLVQFSVDDNRMVDYLGLMRQTDARGGAAEDANTRKFGAVLAITDKEEVFRQQLGKATVDPEKPGVEVPLAGGYTEHAIYVKTNDATTRRGLPPLYNLIDYADLLDQFVYERMKLLEAVMRIWLDVKIEGADDSKLKDLTTKVYGHIPASGSCDLHNEKVTTETRCFQLDGAAIGNDWATFLQGWELATGMPTDILTGKKTIEAGSMVHKTLQAMQHDFEEVIRILADCAIAAKRVTGGLPDSAKDDYEVIFPTISAADMGKIATAINQIALSLLVGEQEGWISPPDAAGCYVEALDMALDTPAKALRPKLKPQLGDPGALGASGGADPLKPEGAVRPQGGAKQSGQSSAFETFTKNGQKINTSKSKVTRA